MNAFDRPEPLDRLSLYGQPFSSRLILGTAQYPSPAVLAASVEVARIDIVTVSLRRETAGGKSPGGFLDFIRDLGVRVLPNTAGCRTARDAITTAQMAREVFATDWIKLEVTGNDDTLHPEVFGLVEASQALVADGFKVLPYTTDDLGVAERLVEAGCQVLMPWGAPIGSGQGLPNKAGLRALRSYFKETPLIVDAGLGAPSHAAAVMELGYDAVLLNTAVAKARHPERMAGAFADAVRAGRSGYLAGLMEPRDMASPSTPVAGTPFFEVRTAS